MKDTEIKLKNIKSKYNIKNTLLFLEEKKKLEIIKYSKYYQNILEIDIENYKNISKKYKIDGINGNGKEYLIKNNRLIFEGEYLNGKRNGKGKEYNDNWVIKYEGEYLNGKRNGKGKEYYHDGKLMFEGEYLYGFRLKGKEYINEKLEYEGEYLYYTKWNGKGYDKNGNIDFEIKNGSGKGKEYNYYGKLMFEGDYLNGERNGHGK